MKVLDLFCGAGGAAYGYHLAGHEVTGIDIRPQPHFPFRFIQGNALEADLNGFDMIHASPPCQRYTTGGRTNRAGRPDLIGPVRDLLEASGLPWIIENVPESPLRADLTLCGSMFGLSVRRHRLFEFWDAQTHVTPPCDHSNPVTGVYGNAHGKRGAWPGMLPSDLKTWRWAMGIDWMTAREITEAIPPAYTKFIGERVIG